jgi:uncharacterized protein YlxW (UPF0749 family)
VPDVPESEAVQEPTAVAGRRALLAQLAYHPSRPHLMIGALFLLLGLLITVAVIRPEGEDDQWRTARTEDLVQILDDLGSRQQRLEDEAARLVALQRDLETGSTAEALAEAQRRLEALQVLSATTPVSGPGLTITLDDVSGRVDSSVLVDAVQELRDAGAEAIQVGDTRVGVSTWFSDGEEGVTVNGQPVGDPIRIMAIGEPETMSAAMSIPGGFAETVRTRGAQFTATPATNMTISVTVPVSAP